MKTRKFLLLLFLCLSVSMFAQEEEDNMDIEIDEDMEVDKSDDNADIMADAETAKEAFLQADASLKEHLENAAGYAIFPNIGKGALLVGVSSGNGVVYVKEDVIGYADIKKLDIGLQAGGKAFSELIIFKSEDALNRFKDDDFEFAAGVSAVILKTGKEAQAKYNDGVAVFALPKAGLMAEASVGGQKFDFKPIY